MRWIRIGVIFGAVACSDVTTPPQGTTSLDQVSLAPGRDGAPPVVFNVQLRAENEPGPISTSEALGHAQVVVLASGTMEFTFTINNKGGEVFNRAHIHKAPAGSNGPIHWDFLEAGDPVASVDGQPSQLRGVARARAAAVLADLLANPEQYYVNIHSTDFPAGAVRGQLR
jgi:hypothetical protein